jgi:DNA (cytosine-5)-methyltransferase 1
MNFGSLCSGIEAAAVAWKPLGWRYCFGAEVDLQCSELLAEQYKEVPNFGDITKIETIPAVDVMVAGTPCQSFSVNGKRAGMDDDRGQLAIAFTRIIGRNRPPWIVWENVPGVLSSNSGRDFGAFLGSLEKLGYGWAYRVLDSRHFGVPQRRRRVYVVGHFRSWQAAAAVLFDAGTGDENAATVSQSGIKQINAGSITGETLYGFTGDTTPKFGEGVTPTLRAGQGGESVGVISESMFRKLTAIEWERLQGFPDNYTAAAGASENQRKRMLGNSFSVPVIRWIGERIDAIRFHA